MTGSLILIANDKTILLIHNALILNLYKHKNRKQRVSLIITNEVQYPELIHVKNKAICAQLPEPKKCWTWQNDAKVQGEKMQS